MKKKKLLCSAVALATCIPMLAGCTGGNTTGGGTDKYTVTYYDSDGTTVLL